MKATFVEITGPGRRSRAYLGVSPEDALNAAFNEDITSFGPPLLDSSIVESSSLLIKGELYYDKLKVACVIGNNSSHCCNQITTSELGGFLLRGFNMFVYDEFVKSYTQQNRGVLLVTNSKDYLIPYDDCLFVDRFGVIKAFDIDGEELHISLARHMQAHEIFSEIERPIQNLQRAQEAQIQEVNELRNSTRNIVKVDISNDHDNFTSMWSVEINGRGMSFVKFRVIGEMLELLEVFTEPYVRLQGHAKFLISTLLDKCREEQLKFEFGSSFCSDVVAILTNSLRKHDGPLNLWKDNA